MDARHVSYLEIVLATEKDEPQELWRVLEEALIGAEEHNKEALKPLLERLSGGIQRKQQNFVYPLIEPERTALQEVLRGSRDKQKGLFDWLEYAKGRLKAERPDYFGRNPNMEEWERDAP